MLIRQVCYIFFCGIAGGAISAGYVAFITLLGVFDKLAEKFKAGNKARLIETFIIIGVSLGNLLYMFHVKIGLGVPGLVIFNLFGGIFTGCLAGALAETIKIFPILSRRFGIRNLLPYVLMAAAIGKSIGCFVNLYFM